MVDGWHEHGYGHAQEKTSKRHGGATRTSFGFLKCALERSRQELSNDTTLVSIGCLGPKLWWFKGSPPPSPLAPKSGGPSGGAFAKISPRARHQRVVRTLPRP